MSDRTAAPTRRRGLSRKIRALLAGGVVLGVGAVATLAAWNDSEYATGTFTAGSFNLQGTTGGADGTYTDHASAGAAAVLPVTTNAGNLSPGAVTYTAFWVRLAAGTTTPATLVLTGVTGGGTGNAANLAWTVDAIPPAATCGAATVGTGTRLGAGTTLNAVGTPGTTPVPLAIGAGTPTAAGAAVQLCFAVTASASLAQGQTGIGTWQFTATSTS